MTENEMLIRARLAVVEANSGGSYQSYCRGVAAGDKDGCPEMRLALLILRNLDKPVPDPGEAWRPALQAYYDARGYGVAGSTPFDPPDLRCIAGLKAARHLMPKED